MVSEPEREPDLPLTGAPPVVPRPLAELAPLLAWLRDGRPAGERLDFTAGTALPDGRLDPRDPGLRRPGPLGALVPRVPDGPRLRRHRSDGAYRLARGGQWSGDRGSALTPRRSGS